MKIPLIVWFHLILMPVLLTACAGVQFVAPYDEVIYDGLTEYKGELNLHVKNMADLGGTPAGTYEANKLKYNEMETRLELLIDRARAQSTGNGCLLSPALAGKVNTYMHDKAPAELKGTPSDDKPTTASNSYGCTEILLIKVKVQLEFIETIHREADRCPLRSPASVQIVEVEISGPETAATSDLDQAVDQAVAEVVESLRATLTSALMIRLDGLVVASSGQADDTAVEEVPTISCLRPATAVTALAISNQSIDAAWVVENAKKQGVE
jgi:hypothetical protein